MVTISCILFNHLHYQFFFCQQSYDSNYLHSYPSHFYILQRYELFQMHFRPFLNKETNISSNHDLVNALFNWSITLIRFCSTVFKIPSVNENILLAFIITLHCCILQILHLGTRSSLQLSSEIPHLFDNMFILLLFIFQTFARSPNLPMCLCSFFMSSSQPTSLTIFGSSAKFNYHTVGVVATFRHTYPANQKMANVSWYQLIHCPYW